MGSGMPISQSKTPRMGYLLFRLKRIRAEMVPLMSSQHSLNG